MSAMYAARFPDKVRSLVLAGAPIDTDAGDGVIKKMAHELPTSFYEGLVAAGNGRMLGAIMLAGWKSMHPENQFEKYIDLYGRIDDTCYVRRAERFGHPFAMVLVDVDHLGETGGSVTLSALEAHISAGGGFELHFGASDVLNGSFSATYCAGGHEP